MNPELVREIMASGGGGGGGEIGYTYSCLFCGANHIVGEICQKFMEAIKFLIESVKK